MSTGHGADKEDRESARPSAAWDDDRIDLTIEEEEDEFNQTIKPKLSPHHLCPSQNSPHRLTIADIKKESKDKNIGTSTSRLKSTVGFTTAGARKLNLDTEPSTSKESDNVGEAVSEPATGSQDTRSHNKPP